jgi:hypothetical protein
VATETDVEGYNIYVFTSNTPNSGKIIKRVGHTGTSVAVYVGDVSEDTTITIASGTA